MEENMKVTHAKNMNKLNFNLTISIPVDTNVNIKKVLDVSSYMFDQKIECGSGKAILNGKVGVKVLYLDTDNMTNTLNESTSFSETFLDGAITSDTHINVSELTIVNHVLSTEGNLKINCDVNISPVAYINLALANNLQTSDFMITKKSQIVSNSIDKFINTKFEYTTNLETKDKINKVLCHNSYFSPENIATENGYAVVEGKLVSSLLYESSVDEETHIKEMKEVSKVKCDVEIDGLNKDNSLDLSFYVDKSNEEISTELEDNLSVVKIKNSIKVCGAVLKTVSIDIIDDLFSTENEIETTITKREYTKKAEHYALCETILNETSLSGEEPAIDEIVANLNQNAEVTNSYIKDNTIYVEGVVTSNLTYIDENKELKNKQLEIPFIINTKVSSSNLGCVHSQVSILDYKIKVKRGTNIEAEYSLYVNLGLYEKETHEMVDTFKIGKKLDFSKYDFQIFIAKPNETVWDISKRIKISPNDLNKYNKDLPLVMEGGEKIIIKR